jgi:spermidine/putrescine transport system substrate-binding protein
MTQPDEIKILAHDSFRRSLSRRSFLQRGGAAAGMGLFLIGCGSSKTAGSAPTAAATGGPTPAANPATTAGSTAANSTTAASATTTAAATTSASAPVASAVATEAAGPVTYSTVVNKASGTLAMYTWGDYNDPTIVGSLAESTLGVKMKVDYYTSNEDLIAKLSAAKGTTGYDIVVPTGPYIPQMIQKGLLLKFDKSKLPNITNIDPLYLGQAWDPGNEYSVCKDWGTTGWFYDKTKVKANLATWSDFITACQTEASGNCSVLDTPANLCGMYFWANGIDWNTEKKADLDACESFLVDKFAKHIKAFDSYPSDKLAQGAYTLSMMWNGDARQAYIKIKDAGGNPDNFAWGIGAPDTELWMDNYAIATGAPNPDAAHAWINWLLVPETSIKDLAYHGYNSGMKSISALIKQYQPDLPHPEMVFFSDAQVKTMHTQKITSSQDRLVEIQNKVKAKAGG